MSTNWADRIIFEDDYPKIDFSVMFLKFDEIDSKNVQYNNDSAESLYNKKLFFSFLQIESQLFILAFLPNKFEFIRNISCCLLN